MTINKLVVAFAVLLLTAAPNVYAGCSNASTTGNWAYTYTGTIFTPNGPLPAASVGHFFQDSTDNVSSSQTRSVAGSSGVEDISGTVSVNKDCTGTGTINVFVSGQLQRTATIALVYDSDTNHLRGIFDALTMPNGTNVPVVLAIDGTGWLQHTNEFGQEKSSCPTWARPRLGRGGISKRLRQVLMPLWHFIGQGGPS